MIVEKQPLPDDPTPPDAPPSYDTIPQRPNQSFSFPLTEKSTSTSSLGHGASPRSPSPQLPSSPPGPGPSQSPTTIVSPTGRNPKGQTYTRPGHASANSKGKGKGWFNFSSTRNTREVRQTVIGLIRGLVRQPQRTSSYETLGILESCADACTSYDLSLSSLLQDPFIEGHTPLYWAIIKRPPETPNSDDDATVPDFLTMLLSFSDPLTPETKSEMRLACLLTSDQPLFQRLRLSPEFSPLSGTDQILLGASMPPDEIVVGDVPGDEGAFVVHFEIVQFQQRMRVSKQIELEFIARGRMWGLSFSIAPHTNKRSEPKPGSWCLTLALLEHSPPTWIDSRFLIEEPRPDPDPSSSSSLIDGSPITTATSRQSPSRSKPKPTICLRLKTGSTQLIAPSSESGKNGCDGNQNEIVVSLDESLMGSSLQYDGSSYIASDGTLRARLEARLAKPETECIIC